ncbi:MAG: DUF4404 family protein [Oceanicoccus sp.]|uniref:DUF4404 family protein n=1 Tax=Oceanicoccus sp. TaxID=2691044 RepID=UPI00262F477C|nr:DUF4404 family protein [Oceanicoccus sp.]MCP3908540.1 DUF4404 family protein [Oceanicoccus sp.]MDG1773229.1 DUF4404 family protein [Oceanicoccus sp.]
MDQQQLREYLDQLNQAIDGMQAPDADKQQLNNLIVDIEQQLTAPLMNEPHSLVEQVDEMVSGFERDHPTVAGILNNIMVTLTSMGV